MTSTGSLRTKKCLRFVYQTAALRNLKQFQPLFLLKKKKQSLKGASPKEQCDKTWSAHFLILSDIFPMCRTKKQSLPLFCSTDHLKKNPTDYSVMAWYTKLPLHLIVWKLPLCFILKEDSPLCLRLLLKLCGSVKQERKKKTKYLLGSPSVRWWC